MALFSRADAGLPLMTHFLRIEIPSGLEEDPMVLFDSEVNAFAAIAAGKAEGAVIVPGVKFYELSHPENNSESKIAVARAHNSMGSNVLLELVKLHRIFCNVTDAHLSQEPISFTKREELLMNDFSAILRYTRETFMPPGLWWDDEKRVVLRYIPWGGGFGPLARGVHLLLEEFYETLGKGLLLTCQECKQGFAGLKPGQRFCSHRCAHREGSRRRYAKKPGFEDSDTKK
jgi:hypothetical protein